MPPTIVKTAALAPGTCFLSGDFNGPFIDTGKSIPGRGRIYIGLKALVPLLRDLGYVKSDDVQAQLDMIAELEAEVDRKDTDAARYREIVAALAPHLPAPTAERVEVGIVLDPKLEAQVRTLEAKVAELRKQLQDRPKQPVSPPSPGSAGGEAPAPRPTVSMPDPEVIVHGQSVQVPELLKLNAPDIIDMVEDWPFEALQTIAVYERAGRNRKSVLRAVTP